MKIVVIIPTYNEAENVEKTTIAMERVFRQLPPTISPHILFVDDSSPDGTEKVIRTLMRTRPRVHLLVNKFKGGLGHAYKKGMLFALDRLHSEIIVCFDADLQHDPERLPAMLEAIQNGADLVLGSRYIPGGGIPENWGLHRKFLSIVGNLFISGVMLNFKIHDWTTGYRAIRANVVKQIVPRLSSPRFSGYTWQVGFLINTVAASFRVAEVPFVFRDRKKGSSKLGPEYIINNMLFILKMRFSQIFHHRLFKFVMVGGIGSLVQFTALYFYRTTIPFQLAFFLSIETSIVSNFILSNLWTFADRKLKASQIPGKFIQFNLASGGSILIQQIVALIGEHTIGLIPLFVIPLLYLPIDSGIMFAVVGILIGMFWNFFAYNRLIWRKK